MKKAKNLLLAFFLLTMGIVFALYALEFNRINISFDGLWTLFIIVPCLADIFTEQCKNGAITGIIIGFALLLSAHNSF